MDNMEKQDLKTNHAECSEKTDAKNVEHSITHETTAHGRKGLRVVFAILHLVLYFTIFAFTLSGGIAAERILFVIFLYVLSASCWAPEFMYLLKGKPFLLLDLLTRNHSTLVRIILAHAVMLVFAYGALLLQFAV